MADEKGTVPPLNPEEDCPEEAGPKETPPIRVAATKPPISPPEFKAEIRDTRAPDLKFGSFPKVATPKAELHSRVNFDSVTVGGILSPEVIRDLIRPKVTVTKVPCQYCFGTGKRVLRGDGPHHRPVCADDPCKACDGTGMVEGLLWPK